MPSLPAGPARGRIGTTPVRPGACRAPDGARSPGFDALAGQMVGKQWPHDDGPVTGIGLRFIEPGWQVSVAHELCGG